MKQLQLFDIHIIRRDVHNPNDHTMYVCFEYWTGEKQVVVDEDANFYLYLNNWPGEVYDA